MNIFFKQCCLSLGVLAGVFGHAHAESARLRVMLLSGSNNHDWKITTPKLTAVLADSGRFQVQVVDDVAALSADSFASCDVILSNYNTFNDRKPTDAVWKAPVREALLAHIRAGHGFVVVHAGSSTFYDWPEFQKLAATSWTLGTTRHVRPHAGPVTFGEVDHPITRGLPSFWTYDEFWEDVVVQPEARALAWVIPDARIGGSGKAEPIMFVTEFGQGRGFCLLLGHDEHCMKSPAFPVLLRRGTEWAATGSVITEPAALEPPWPTTDEAALTAAGRVPIPHPGQ